jgi:putative redox protein
MKVKRKNMNSEIMWLGKMAFEAKNRSHQSRFDVSPDNGGEDSAPTPKEILLNSMCTCSAMDVVSIAEKMRLKIEQFSMKAEATKTSTLPSYFSAVHMEYYIAGDLESEKIIKAVVLSMTKYCGVSFMISKICPITYDVYLNGKLVHQDKANFMIEAL